MTRALFANDELMEPGLERARWQVMDPRPRDGCIKLFDRESHQDKYELFEDINQALVEGRLVLVRKGTLSTTVPLKSNTELDESMQRAIRLVATLKGLMAQLGVSLHAAYDYAKKEQLQGADAVGSFPSKATIYRYFKASRDGLPLLKGEKYKGNRTARYSEAITNLVCDAANDLFLQPGSRWNLNDLVQHVNRSAAAQGLLGPDRHISRKFVLKTIYTNLSVDPAIERMDPRLVAAAKSIASKRIVASAPFQRVEQDAVHLPFVVTTPHGITSNIYLIHAIDCCTAMPLGWHVVIGAPCESDGLACVESILFSKKEAFKRLGLNIDLDVFGTPGQLVFDNGPEARGERIHRLVRLHIDVMHCKSRHAHGKPYVERMNRSLKEALQTLPGCTRFDGKDGQRDPIALGDKLIDIEELEKWVVRWYFEAWANTPLKRHLRSDFSEPVKLGNTPAQRWRTMTQELAWAMPLSPPIADWRRALYEHEVRMLSRKTGITYRSFNYRGEHLSRLIQKHGEAKVNVLVNPDDYRQIFVDEGEGLPLVPLTEEFTHGTTPAYSYAQAEALLKEHRTAESENPTRAQFRADVHQRAIAEPTKSGGKKQSKAEKNRAVADRAKEAQAIRRAIERPVSAAAKRNPSTSQTDSLPMAFDNIAPLPVLDRTTGTVR